MSKPILKDLFAFHGRRNRKSYALLCMALFGGAVGFSLAVLVLDEILAGTGVTAAVLVFAIVLLMSAILLITSAQRCRDVGLSGAAGLAVLLPLGFIALQLWPGEKGTNRFGLDPREIKR
jgi:uncharacterized membrane protein YhaH (DUF805 family)